MKRRYAQAALQVLGGGAASCCASGSGCGPDPITGGLYEETETAVLPETAVAASLGCALTTRDPGARLVFT
ncbi:MAG: hypothetical protein ACPL7M_09890 [Bryobacteraceae bacterium]